MHYRADNTRRFPKRPFYDTGEIDALMEKVLLDAGRPRIGNGPAIDIDKVLLRLGLEPDYRDLPDDVIGATYFTKDGSAEIVISPKLSEAARTDPVAELRLRTTTAHELGHDRLHRPLYFTGTPDLFNLPEPQPILCKASSVGERPVGGRHYTGEWWEWQANQAMAALLMPREEFITESRTWASSRRLESPRDCHSVPEYRDYVAHMGMAFHVSQEAARYRAEALDMGHREKQPDLGV